MKLLPLLGTRGEVVASAKVDDCWWPLLSQFEWFAHVSFGYTYPATSVGDPRDGNYIRLFLHNLVCCDLAPGQLVDYLDHDRLNLQSNNLRPAIREQVAWRARTRKDNTSGERGVYLERKTGLWVARVYQFKRKVFERRFKSLAEAKNQVRAAREHYYGEFARGS